MNTQKADVAVIGAGVLGLAHAYLAARQGRSVVVFERTPKASGASVRNFGMVWPIGQPAGDMYQMALRSRELWMEVLDHAKLPYLPTGSLHVVYRDDEAAVAREFAEIAPQSGYSCQWLTKSQTSERTSAVVDKDLQGALWSNTELTVDPRLTIASLPDFLKEQFNVRFRFGSSVRSIQLPKVETGAECWEVGQAVVCGGDDFENLYPEQLRAAGITRCKLQMLRTVPQPEGWKLGPALAAGLTLRFYAAFGICKTLSALKARITAETPEYDQWFVHGLVSQTAQGELTLGDSHQYGLAVDIFDRTDVDELILRYLRTFLVLPSWEIAQRWHGVYAKHPQKSFVSITPAENVRIVTATGGSGMTLSFGLAEQTLREMGIG